MNGTPHRPWYARPWFHVVVILVVAAAFRLWQLTSLPPGLFGDEATDGLDALDVLAGRGAVFFPANFGREGLHMWIVALAFRLLGVTPLALRLPSALAGILTALATYWLGRELAAADEGRRTKDEGRADSQPALSTHAATSLVFPLSSFVPLVAALYLATSYWHVHFSRFGIRGVFTPLCGALAFAAFWRGINRRSYAWFAAAGLGLGIATHFYTASRFFPFFLAGFLLVQWLVARLTGGAALLPRHWRGILVMYALALLVFGPLGLYFLQHPGSFSQRASAVTAFGTGTPWQRMAQAALANVLQFVVPGRGDVEQFYNLPGRAVFDGVTALLALAGIAALIWRWRRGPALFLLLWFPALLLPSFLATDRWPTLPRVLGVIPGVYFFPAVGLAAAAGWVMRRATRAGRSGAVALGGPAARPGERVTSSERPPVGARDASVTEGSGEAQGFASIPSAPSAVAPIAVAPITVAPITVAPSAVALIAAALIAGALLLHAGLAYRDYFRVWGPSQATFDAFEGDMTAAARWLAEHPDVSKPAHVYLSSDIYRHPTFMLLHEHATVQTYFTHTDPQLSWFDARYALPLPADGPTVYLIPASAALTDAAAQGLAATRPEVDVRAGPDGSPALTALILPAGARVTAPRAETESIAFAPQLSLAAAQLAPASAGPPQLTLLWRTSGPDPAEWRAYRLEIELPAADGTTWGTALPFDAFRPAEWLAGGAFLTWHALDGFRGELPAAGRLRLIRQRDGLPAVLPDAADGWQAVTFAREGY